VTAADRLRLSRPRVARHQLERLRNTFHPHDFVILAYVQLEVLRHAAIVRQRFAPRGLVPGSDERNPDLELLGCGEERHVQGIALQAGNDGALVEKRAREMGPLCSDAHGEPAGPRADYRKIEHQEDSVTSLR